MVSKTGVINDPLGQTHNLANSEYCIHLDIHRSKKYLIEVDVKCISSNIIPNNTLNISSNSSISSKNKSCVTWCAAGLLFNIFLRQNFIFNLLRARFFS